MLKILIPETKTCFQDLAAEFTKLYKAVTGNVLHTVFQDDGTSDLICFGTDADSALIHQWQIEKKIPNFSIRYGSDSYQILSACIDQRKMLFLVGGNTRAFFYAVYDFFEKAAGCHWFWDGDRIPKAEHIPIEGWDIRESPRFEYRGLRYFAHRGLMRFQAEHWDFEDWKKEFDWVLKKRLNLAMLRIGMDDLFQKAFPQIVPYPDWKTQQPERVDRSYDDRTLFWPLEYRGELRKKVLAYGRSRGLLQPEDCGTMTHWYSRTPESFLNHYNPDFVPQSNNNYKERSGLVWDIRQEQNMENYFALTEAHIQNYGDGQIFHTIGLAERRCYADREKNHQLKLYTYRRIINKLREKYPHAPLLIASWDFVSTWTHDEVKSLIDELNPQNCLILDYTSDIYWETNNFRNWGIVGKFPWIYGIFHAFEASTEIRGMYDNIAYRFPIAAEDPMCKGVVYWPENSHSDSLMLDYFPAIAWDPSQYRIEKFIPGYCKRRYPAELAPEMEKIWLDLLPAIKACTWGAWAFDGPQREVYPDPYFAQGKNGVWYWGEIDGTRLELFSFKYRELHDKVDDIADVLDRLAKLDFNALDEFSRRDVLDLARTAFSRVMNYAMARFGLKLDCWCTNSAQWFAKLETSGEELLAEMKKLRQFAHCLTELLEASGDFSLNVAMAELRKRHEVNPVFEHTLKGNAENNYCRSFVYELAKECYEPALAEYEKLLIQRVQDDDRRVWNGLTGYLKEKMAVIENAFYEKELSKMAPDITAAGKRIPQTLSLMAELTRQFK